MSKPQAAASKQAQAQGSTSNWRSSPEARVAAVVLLAGVLPFLGMVVAGSLLRGRYVHQILHSCLELAGACIAVAVATLLWFGSQCEKEASHLVWTVVALVAMGLVDGAHGVAPFGVAWSWFRHSATLLGGLLFAMVWLAPASLRGRRKKLFLVAVIVSSEYLTSRGYKVLQGINGADALQILEQSSEEIHLMVTDVVMPGMSGADLAQRVRQLRLDIRVLYVSGYTERMVVQHGIEATGGFLQKSFSLAAFGRKVREMLDAGQRNDPEPRDAKAAPHHAA